MLFRIGVIGCGYWGKNYLRVFDQLPGSRVVAFAELDSDRRAELAAASPRLAGYRDYRELLAGEECDAVVVATEATKHHEIIKAALEAGLHVLAEKPITTAMEQAEELVDLAHARNLKLLVGHTFLYNVAIHRMKEMLLAGEAGDIYYMHATRTHLGPIRADVNAIWDLAAHDVAIFNYLNDAAPVRVVATGAAYLQAERMDVAFLTLTYPGGRLGSIHVSWIDTNKVRTVAVVGSEARLLFDDLNNLEKIRIFRKGISVQRRVADFGEFQYLLRDGDIISPKLCLREPLRVQCEDFIASISGGTEPLSNGRTGLDVVRVLAAADLSLARGGEPVDIS